MCGRRAWSCVLLASAAMGPCVSVWAQNPTLANDTPSPQIRTAGSDKTIPDYNLHLRQLQKALRSEAPLQSGQDYRVGREDLLEISVFEAQEFNTIARVSASGEISIPMLGTVHAGGLTPRELESVLAELLRRTYMKDPHVSVFVKEMQSHAVSVFGAVRKPGLIQIRAAKTLIEVLSQAEGLADDAGDTVLVTHQDEVAGFLPVNSTSQPLRQEADPVNRSSGVSPTKDAPDRKSGAATEEINLKELLESSDPFLNVLVYPGDSVTVPHAGIVYVVGEVRKPGGFQLKNNEKITVLQALALAEGVTRTAAKGRARIMRTDPKTRARAEIPIDLSKILSGKVLDPELQSRDILFVPNSTGHSAFNRGLEAAVAVGSGLAIYRF